MGVKLVKANELRIVKPKPLVRGPIRCHKCQLMCVDAEHYLSHSCTPRGAQ